MAAASAPEFGEGFRAKFAELLIWRRDVRHFLDTPLPEGWIGRLLAVPCLGPSVGLSQPWRFVLVERAPRRQAVRENFAAANAAALAAYHGERAALYAKLKLAGLETAPV